ncbi:asparaginase [Iamia sp. SCSIO 61187]|uniref:asparaginase n=1 Tax=Iamia sp. SCSIO 61187 TaxID=2722752 RepID=UPI001C630F5A|nr:asparaginase [Iamia sp. SCSIO 61187]QYG91252.1 asparaginase [Iamia sp. SCSIO 61187]
MDPSDPVLVEVVRDGWVESVHRGRLLVLAADGRALVSLGAVEEAVLLRSCAKPLQAWALVRAGWTAPPEQVALACASHGGTDRHVAVVGEILAAAGLDADALGTTPGYALDPDAAATQRVEGGPTALRHNCSGKHAAMLATCALLGHPTETYLEPDHPVQADLVTRQEELIGSRCLHLAVDGCGAPIGAFPLEGLARAYARIATAPVDGRDGPVAAAMRLHPDLVAGDGRAATTLMRAIPGLIAKDGAEGLFAAALPDGRAVAVKVDDGATRAASVVAASALAHLVRDEPGVDLDLLADVALPDVDGGGRPVGEIRSIV